MEVLYISPAGKPWSLTDPDSHVQAIEGGLDGLTGQFSPVSVYEGAGRQTIVSLNDTPMEVSAEFAVEEDRAKGLTAEEVANRFVRSWSVRSWGTIVIKHDDGRTYTTKAKLAEAIPAPAKLWECSNVVRFSASIVSERGFWERHVEHELTKSGDVYLSTITNDGDYPIYPSFTWYGKGTKVKQSSEGLVLGQVTVGGRLSTGDTYHELKLVNADDLTGYYEVRLCDADDKGFTFDTSLSKLDKITTVEGAKDSQLEFPIYAGIQPGETLAVNMSSAGRVSYVVRVVDPWR